jgi:hypothetical protein
MGIIVYGIIAAVLLGAGFYGGYQYESGQWAKENAARLKAETKLIEAANHARAEAETKIQDMATAFEVGQSKAKVVYRNVQARGASDVSSHPVFSNRACDWPAASVQLINSAFASLRSPADTSLPPPALPAAGAAAGGAAGSGVPVAPVAPGAVVEVRGDARSASGGGQVPAGDPGKPPKPVPRSK